MSKPLTPKQEAFAVGIAKGAASSEAYVNAYGAGKGSPTTHRVEAHRLLRHPTVAQRIKELQAPTVAAIKRAVDIDLTRTIFENARVAFSDIRRLFNEDGTMKAPKDWDDDLAAAVSSIKVRKLYGEGKDGVGAIGTVTEVKLWDKGAALERLMKHFGGFAKDNEQRRDDLTGVDRAVLKMIEERILGLPSGRPLVGGHATGSGSS